MLHCGSAQKQVSHSLSVFPQIMTERLILRDFNAADANAVFEILPDDRMMEFYDCGTFSNIKQANKLVAEKSS